MASIMTSIVVVEDEVLLADAVCFLLEQEGYRVESAHHGRRALEVIERIHPALVITDFMMPLMTGLELAEYLKADPRYVNLPLILVSGAQGAVARTRLDLFAAVFDKPYAPDLLLAKVRELTAHVKK